jgi:hypothetical protein
VLLTWENESCDGLIQFKARSTFQVKQNTGFYPRVQVDTSPSPAVGQAGAVLLTDTIRVSGLDAGLAAALGPWRKPTAIHHPAKIVCDLAVALAVGGDCLADVAVVRGEPGLFGHVASDATVSRLVDTLAGDVDAAVARSTPPARPPERRCGSSPATRPPTPPSTRAAR